MKKTIMKMASVSLCVVLATSGVGMTTYALSADKSSNNTISEENSVKTTAVNTDENALVKNETVYVIAGAEGSVKKIIVSDWIKNALGSSSITDKSSLTDVENVKGDESYTMSGDDMRVWDAAGNDIYYKGNIEKELPVNMSVTYKLDGKNISAEELAGKSGKVTIRFDYKNNQYQTVSIDGKEEKIYVPFAMLTGIILNNDVFTNVSVSNGKIINDGDKTIIAGIAFPGLQESLGVSEEKLEIPDYVDISADVKNFSMTSTVTIATNEVFNKIDTESLASVDELTEAASQLSTAMNELMDGSSQLYAGLSTLLDKSGELIAGIDKLAAGAEQLKAGASQVNTGAGRVNEGALQLKAGTGSVAAGASQLQTGTADLSEGLNSLSASNDTLNGGAKQVFETLLATARGQLAASGLTVPQLTTDNYAEVLDGVTAMLNANGAGEAAKTVSSLKASLDSYNTFYKGLAAYTAGVENAAAGAAQLKAGAEQLNTGAAQLNTGAEQLSAGTASLKDGTSQLYAGADELCSGILTLKNGAPALTDGIKQLQSGSMQLSDGLKEFNEKGIKKLTDYVSGDIDELVTRVKAIGDVSKSYSSFSGISDDMEGEVKFIYRTDSVKSEN